MKFSRKFLFFIFLFVTTKATYGQDGFLIYSFDYKIKNKSISLINPKYISGFNETGYVNQPNFIDDLHVFVTSNHEDGKFNDVYKVNVNTGEFDNITKSMGKSEYSPTPYLDGKHFFNVREEGDGKTQAFHKYPMDMKNQGVRVLPSIDNIGYFLFLDLNNFVYFAVEQPNNKLYHASLDGNIKKEIIKNPGRAIKKTKNGLVYFSEESEDKTYVLKTWNIKNNKIKTVCSLPSQDFNITPKDEIVCTKNSKLYIYDKKINSFLEAADLASFGLNSLSRLTFNKNKLVIVSNK